MLCKWSQMGQKAFNKGLEPWLMCGLASLCGWDKLYTIASLALAQQLLPPFASSGGLGIIVGRVKGMCTELQGKGPGTYEVAYT